MTVLSNFEKVQEFNKAMEVKPDRGTRNILFRMKLIEEELKELKDELYLDPEDMVYSKVAKEMADLLYVVYGMADALDIPIDAVFWRVHESNMSKLGEDGKPIRREDGKVMKGPNYQPPYLDDIK